MSILGGNPMLLMYTIFAVPTMVILGWTIIEMARKGVSHCARPIKELDGTTSTIFKRASRAGGRTIWIRKSWWLYTGISARRKKLGR
jgi:hypothetical protein